MNASPAMPKTLRSNAGANFLAGLIPALVVLVTTPVLVRGLGTVDYGLLIVVSSVAGYLAILDVNLTAGSIKYISEYYSIGDRNAVRSTFSFGLIFYLGIAITGAAAISLGAPILARWFGSEVNGTQAVEAFMVASLGFALGQINAYLISVPQALQRYDLSGRVEAIAGIAAPALSATAVAFGASLTDVIWLRNAVLLLSLAFLGLAVRRLLPWLNWRWPGAAQRAQLVRFSAYAYLAKLAAVTYLHGDKLVIATVLDVKSVAIYAVPTLLANRLFSTTFRITQVVFPASSALLKQGRSVEVKAILLRSTSLVFTLNACLVVALFLVGDVFLRAWVGAEFAGTGYRVLMLVCGGLLVDSLTNPASLITDSSGRPDVTGRFALLRACVGLAGLLVGAKLGGVVGVALSHLLVSSLFSLAFVAFVMRWIFPMSMAGWLRQAVLPGLGVALTGLCAGWAVRLVAPGDTVLQAVCAAGAAVAVMVAAAWLAVLSASDRAMVVAAVLRRSSA